MVLGAVPRVNLDETGDPLQFQIDGEVVLVIVVFNSTTTKCIDTYNLSTGEVNRLVYPPKMNTKHAHKT